MLKRGDFIGSAATVAAVLTLGCSSDDSGTDAGTGGTGAGGTSAGGSSTGGAASGGAASGGSNTGGSTLSGGSSNSGGTSSGGSATGGGSSTDECGVNIVTDHEHELVVSQEDVDAGVEKEYVMSGEFHTHSFLLTAADFVTLAAGNPVTKESGPGGLGDHTHSTTVTCAG